MGTPPELLSPLPLFKETVRDYERRENDGHHGHQLDQNVQAGTGGILKRIADGISDNPRFVGCRPFTAVVPFFDELFGIVPGPAGISHHYRKYKS